MKLSDYTTYYQQNPDTGKCDIPVLGFVNHGCGTSDHYKQISKERYDELAKLDRGELNAEIEKTISNAVRWGYGYYGAMLYHDEENDLYFLGMCIGNSCD